MNYLQGYDIVCNEGNINKCDAVIIYVKKSLIFTCKVVNIGMLKELQLKIKDNFFREYLDSTKKTYM